MRNMDPRRTHTRTPPLHTRRFRVPSSAAFTLVELLMVVAIIGVLVAILIPSMARSKYLARSALCLSNKRQVMVGLLNYAGDFSHRMPNWAGDGNQYAMQDMPGVVFTVPRDKYNVPLTMWSCPVSDKPQLPAKWGGYGPVYKWKSSGMAWWVIRGSSGNDSKVIAGRGLVSDRISLTKPSDIIVTDTVMGNGVPSSSYHVFNKQFFEAGLVRMDGASMLIPRGQMKVGIPNEGWGSGGTEPNTMAACGEGAGDGGIGDGGRGVRWRPTRRRCAARAADGFQHITHPTRRRPSGPRRRQSNP